MAVYEPPIPSILASWLPPPGTLLDGLLLHQITLRTDGVLVVWAGDQTWTIPRDFPVYMRTFAQYDVKFKAQGYTRIYPPDPALAPNPCSSV